MLYAPWDFVRRVWKYPVRGFSGWSCSSSFVSSTENFKILARGAAEGSRGPSEAEDTFQPGKLLATVVGGGCGDTAARGSQRASELGAGNGCPRANMGLEAVHRGHGGLSHLACVPGDTELTAGVPKNHCRGGAARGTATHFLPLPTCLPVHWTKPKRGPPSHRKDGSPALILLDGGSTSPFPERGKKLYICVVLIYFQGISWTLSHLRKEKIEAGWAPRDLPLSRISKGSDSRAWSGLALKNAGGKTTIIVTDSTTVRHVFKIPFYQPEVAVRSGGWF